MNRKTAKIVYPIVIVLLFLVLEKTNILNQVEIVNHNKQIASEKKIPQIELKKWQDTQQDEITTTENNYTILRVFDGDTFSVADNDNKEYKVRLLGVNTPEVGGPYRTRECFGKEASSFAKQLVSKSSKQARLAFDETQQKYDKYDRLLAYVYLVQHDETVTEGERTSNEIFLNAELVKQGYAYEYTYELPYKFQNEFKNLEQEAKREERGLWSKDSTCQNR